MFELPGGHSHEQVRKLKRLRPVQGVIVGQPQAQVLSRNTCGGVHVGSGVGHSHVHDISLNTSGSLQSVDVSASLPLGHLHVQLSFTSGSCTPGHKLVHIHSQVVSLKLAAAGQDKGPLGQRQSQAKLLNIFGDMQVPGSGAVGGHSQIQLPKFGTRPLSVHIEGLTIRSQGTGVVCSCT